MTAGKSRRDVGRAYLAVRVDNVEIVCEHDPHKLERGGGLATNDGRVEGRVTIDVVHAEQHALRGQQAPDIAAVRIVLQGIEEEPRQLFARHIPTRCTAAVVDARHCRERFVQL